MTLFLFALLLIPFQSTDRTDKPCVITKVVKEGTLADCHGWKPAKGEKMIMPASVNRRLKVGDTYYFVWKEHTWLFWKKGRWVAEIK